MKLKHGSIKKCLIVIVCCFFMSMFMLLDILTREAGHGRPFRDFQNDRQTVTDDRDNKRVPSGFQDRPKEQDVSGPVLKPQDTGQSQQPVNEVAVIAPQLNEHDPALKGGRGPPQLTQGKDELSGTQNISCHKQSFVYNLTELQKETRLIYNMVPKCGSLGIRGILTKSGNKLVQGNYNIGFDFLAPFHHKTEHVVRIVKEDLNRNMKVKYIYQKHLHFVDFSIANAKTPYYMNVIRDPVEHHISLYYFQREGKKLKMFAPWHLLIENSTDARQQRLARSYDDCVRTNDIECSSDNFLFTIIPFFCGQDVHCLKPSREALEQAKQNVNRYYPLLGYVENLKDFFKLGQAIWPQFFQKAPDLYGSGKFTAHKTRARRNEPSEDVKLIMKGRLALEYEFYTWIKQRFHCMYDMYVLRSPVQNVTIGSAARDL